MALDANELLSSAAGLGSALRFFPTSVQPKTFIGGTALLPKGSPVAVVTASGFWDLWDAAAGAAGTEVMKGIIWPDDVQLISGSEVLGMVMLAGRFHISDVVLGVEVLGDLEVELRATARANGYIVEGMDGFS